VKSSNLERVTKLFCHTVSCRVLKPSLEKLAKDELTEVQLACMRYAYLHPEPSVGEIAEGLGISNAASAKLIDRLVRKSLLLREEDPIDRRVLQIKLTPAGGKLLEEINRIERAKFEAVYAKMSAAEREALELGLDGFLKAALETPEQIEEVCLRCGFTHDPECSGNRLYLKLAGHDRWKV
jgi:DNA-binding MarR family transcriptional regulator